MLNGNVTPSTTPIDSAGFASGTAIRIAVRVTPRGGADRIEGVTPAGELRVRVRAAPAEGAANEALARTVADACGVAPSAVGIVRGGTGRTKLIAIEGVDGDALRRRWPGLAVS